MVKLSVLIATIWLIQLAYGKSFMEYMDNEIDSLPSGNNELGKYNEYVRITQPPEKLFERKVFEPVEFKCEATGTPPPTIEWFKEHQKLTENESFEENNDIIYRGANYAYVASRLIINHVLPIHDGTYYCVAKSNGHNDHKKLRLVIVDGHGRVMNHTELAERNIIGAYHLPKVTFYAKSIVKDIGSDVILPCKSVGNPIPDLYWTNNKGEIIRNDEHFEVLPNGELSIKSLSWSDMGDYFCHVKNIIGADSTRTFLYPTMPDPPQ